MNAFADAISEQKTTTTNGMPARVGSADACTDLFFKIGAMRGQDVIPAFTAAYAQHPDTALRIVQWARDVRHGAGERQLFRNILTHLEKGTTALDHEALRALIRRTPELGRWDDLLVFQTVEFKRLAYDVIFGALQTGNGLAAKWMPRKGPVAAELRAHFGMTPKSYRKMLVRLTNVVETQMCAKNWNEINFSHVPSLAASRYKKAFFRQALDSYKEYLTQLVKKDPTKPAVKVNAGAVYPYDVIKTAMRGDREAIELITAQWDALPNFIGDASILPIVDVSGSMTANVGGTTSAMDVSVSLGLYCADKNRGAFKDVFMTFSDTSDLVKLQGNIVQKLDQIRHSHWAMSTNLEAAFIKILDVAMQNSVAKEDMPKTVLIISDMQFNSCVRVASDSSQNMIERMYKEQGYTIPNVVFWNVCDAGNVPVRFDKRGTALVSGFSPSIMKSVLSGKDLTPAAIMWRTVGVDRYDLALDTQD